MPRHVREWSVHRHRKSLWMNVRPPPCTEWDIVSCSELWTGPTPHTPRTLGDWRPTTPTVAMAGGPARVPGLAAGPDLGLLAALDAADAAAVPAIAGDIGAAQRLTASLQELRKVAFTTLAGLGLSNSFASHTWIKTFSHC